MTVCFRFFSRCPIPLSRAGLLALGWALLANCADPPRDAIVGEPRLLGNRGATSRPIRPRVELPAKAARPAKRPANSAFWGHVLTQGGAPLSGATLRLADAAGEELGRSCSGDDGGFVLESIPPGTHWLHVTAPGKQSMRRRVRAPSALQLRLLPARAIGGKVEGAAGKPVDVILVGPVSRRVQRLASAGRFVFDELLPGSYELFASTTRAPWRASAVVVARAGADQVELRMQPASRLEGQVEGEDGAVVAARVLLRPTRPLLTAVEAKTDARGRFAMPPLPAGRYRVEAWAAGYLPRFGEIVELPRRAAPLQLRLSRGHRVTGRVQDEEGRPLTAVLVRFFPGGHALDAKIGELGVVPGPVPPIPPPGARLVSPSAGLRLWSATTDSAGQFVVQGLPRGRARYSADHADHDRLEGQLQIPASKPLELRMRAGAGVEGSVRDWRTSGAISRFSIEVDGKALERRRDARGQFRLRLANGKHRILVRARGYARQSKEVVVESGARPEPLIFELKAAGSIEGSIRDALGRPVAGAELRAGRATAKSDARGRFVLREVPEGGHVVELAVGEIKQRSDTVTVRAGERSGPVRFHLREAIPAQ